LYAIQNGSETKRIASALRRNPNIRHLQVFGCRDPFIISLFDEIASPDTVLSLAKLNFYDRIFGASYSSDVWEAVQHYLETATLECFELTHGLTTSLNVRLPNITQGLIQNTSVKEVVFRNCTVREQDEGPQEHFANLLRKKTNISTLRLSDSTFLNFQHCFNALVELLARKESPLRRLELDVFIFGGVTIALPQFQDLMRIVASSQLEILRLGKFSRQNPCYLQSLANALPSFKVHVINLTIQAGGWTAADKELLLEGFKNNYSVHSVDCKPVSGSRNSWFNDTNQRRLDFFLDRNRKLAQWTENPKLVPPELWVYALDLALKAGVNSLYRSLLALSGHGVGLPQEQQKSKIKTQ